MPRASRYRAALTSNGRFQCALVIALAAAGAWACEDEHPPIVAQPVETFIGRADNNEPVLTLAIDPRGVSAILPAGDNFDHWVDRDDPTGVWHYREWQWWKGHPFGDSCRPRFWADPNFRVERGMRAAAISYDIDGFQCRQAFLLATTVERDIAWWDMVTTVRNVSGRDVDEYGQFFACYTPLNRGRSFWFWDESNALSLFADRNVRHLDGFVAHPRAYFLDGGAIPHCPRGGGKIVGRWRYPVMISHASPAGWRSIILIESAHAASLAQGIEGVAMDYILFPGPKQRTFDNDAEFSAHIRHVMLRSVELPTVALLQELWNEFEQSHATIRERAAKL